MHFRHCAAALLLLCVAVPSAAVTLSADDSARLLAGLPPPADAPAIGNEEHWQLYRDSIQPMWKAHEEGRGAAMTAWAADASAGADADAVFYPFGGPDFLTVQRLHPDARHYTLVAREPAGRLPDLASSDEIQALLAPFASASQQYCTLGYFATAALRRYTTRLGAIEAISGILALSAVRAGYEVESVVPIEFDEEKLEFGPADLESASWDSVRLTLRRKDGEVVILDYVVFDLHDRFLQEHPKHREWIRERAKSHVFLKAATHTLQGRQFATTARLILENAPSVLQDESGLALPALEQSFDVRLFGRFEAVSPHLFRKKGSAEPQLIPPVRKAVEALATAYRERDDVEPLPFEIGYVKPAGSSVQYAKRRSK